jgi:hypothetical protein
MSKLNMNKINTIEEAVKNHKSATFNKEGGHAFKFEDPAEYLLATVGSAMFVEPRYYADNSNLEALKKGEFNHDGLDEQAIKIIDACVQVAEGDNPRDLLALAHWARTELNMRTTPQIMLSVAAKCLNTKQYVRKYVPLVARRADEVKQIVAAYEHLFGWKKFPASLKKGVADRMSTMSEYELMKYNTKGHPSFADILRFCDRRQGYPLSKPLREYILRGEVIDPEATPVIAARKRLTSLSEWNETVPFLAKQAGATWEVLVSQFGSNSKVWESVIPLMGYMALLRNIGNFLDANISMEMVQFVVRKLSDPENVAKSKQLPFRFLAAYRTLFPDTSYLYGRRNDTRDRGSWDKTKLQAFLEGVEAALDASVINVPVLPGVTVIAADNSASMQRALSDKSSMSIRDAANVLCAIVHRRCEKSHVCSFGAEAVWPPITKRSSILTNMEKVATYQESVRGHATNAWKVVDYMIRNNIVADRLIVLSDMQCYDSSGWRGQGQSAAASLTKYRRSIKNDCYAHFYDLQGYGTAQVDKGKYNNIVGGFSEKIFGQVLVFEGAEQAGGDETLPTLGYIRENF